MIYSASWDMTVRVWDLSRDEGEEEEEPSTTDNCYDDDGGGGESRSPPPPPPPPPFCAGLYQLEDWGWSVAPRANRVLVAEGRGAAVFDAETCKVLLRVPPSEADGGRRGDAARVEGTRDGRALFLARADGSLERRDLRCCCRYDRKGRSATSSATTTLLLPGGPPPSGLAFDDPWIALASGRGGVALLDARRPRTPLMTAAATTTKSTSTKPSSSSTSHLPIPRPPRRLGFANNAAVRCVEVLGRWVVGGCDDGSVRTWYFGGGGEGEGTTSKLGGRRRGGGKRRGQRRWRRESEQN